MVLSIMKKLPQSAYLAIWLANLPLSIKVDTTLLASMCRAMPFSARALKIHFLWRWYCGKKTNENAVFRGMYSYRQRERVITLFPNIFSYCFQFLHVERVFRRFWKESRTCTSLQNAAAHFQVRVGVINSQQILTRISFVLNTNRIWFKRGLYSYRQTYALSQLSKICCGLTRLRLVTPQQFGHCDDAYRSR